MMKKRIVIMVCIIIVAISPGQFLFAHTMENISILKISSKDKTAVIRIGDDSHLTVISVGDHIGDRIKVIDITEGRIVMEEAGEGGNETIIFNKENGKTTLLRIFSVEPPKPMVTIPRNSD